MLNTLKRKQFYIFWLESPFSSSYSLSTDVHHLCPPQMLDAKGNCQCRLCLCLSDPSGTDLSLAFSFSVHNLPFCVRVKDKTSSLLLTHVFQYVAGGKKRNTLLQRSLWRYTWQRNLCKVYHQWFQRQKIHCWHCERRWNSNMFFLEKLSMKSFHMRGNTAHAFECFIT